MSFVKDLLITAHSSPNMINCQMVEHDIALWPTALSQWCKGSSLQPTYDTQESTEQEWLLNY